MPRTKLSDKYRVTAPPLDDAWGAVMCRKFDLKMDLKTLADITGYSYDTMRRAWTMHPIEWSQDLREAVMQALGLRCRLVVEDIAPRK